MRNRSRFRKEIPKIKKYFFQIPGDAQSKIPNKVGRPLFKRLVSFFKMFENIGDVRFFWNGGYLIFKSLFIEGLVRAIHKVE